MGVQLVIILAAGLIQAIPQLVAQLPQIVLAILQRIGIAASAVIDIGINIITATGASLIELGDEYNTAVNRISASTGATGQEPGQVAQNVISTTWVKV